MTEDHKELLERLEAYTTSEINPDASLPMKLRVGPHMFRLVCSDAYEAIRALIAERDEWKQAAEVEAGLRRTFRDAQPEPATGGEVDEWADLRHFAEGGGSMDTKPRRARARKAMRQALSALGKTSRESEHG